MTIIINVIIFLAIISYVVFTLFNFFKKAKAGKCNFVALNVDVVQERKHYDAQSILIDSSIFVK